MQSKQDKAIEENLGTIIISFIFGFMKFIRCTWYGFMKFSKSKKMIPLIVLIIMGITLGRGIAILVGVVYLFVLGKVFQYKVDKEVKKETIQKEKLDVKFFSIGFKDKLGVPPKLVCKESIDNYFYKLIFESEITTQEWISNKNKIEEIFNTRIISIEREGGYKVCKCSKLPTPKLVLFDLAMLSNNPYEIFIGLDVYCQPVYINLYKNPHAIVAGSTNGGKSTTAYSMFTQLRRHDCNKIILCDFKKVTFKSLIKYNNNKKAIQNKDDFKTMLRWAKEENDKRIELFNAFDECENLKEYNNLVNPSKQLKNVFIFIDELAVIMKNNDKELEKLITYLTQSGRSQGFYLLVFTQRPSAQTIPAEARANFNIRLSSFQPDKNTSEMAVGDDSCSKLPNIIGRCILKEGGVNKEVQAVLIDKSDISKYLNVATCSNKVL